MGIRGRLAFAWADFKINGNFLEENRIIGSIS
jgi:hypothetical protein